MHRDFEKKKPRSDEGALRSPEDGTWPNEDEPSSGQGTSFFFEISAHADGERRGTRVDLNIREDTSHRDLSDATLRFELALGVRRRLAPKS